VSLYNEKIDRTFRIDGSLSIAAKIAVFVQSISISLDAVQLEQVNQYLLKTVML